MRNEMRHGNDVNGRDVNGYNNRNNRNVRTVLVRHTSFVHGITLNAVSVSMQGLTFSLCLEFTSR